MTIKRGNVFLADLGSTIGSEQKGIRPVLIVQNDIGNRYSNTTIIAALTTKTEKKPNPTHIKLLAEESGLPKDSLILLEHIRTIDKKRIIKYLVTLNDEIISLVNGAIEISLGLITIQCR